jgi:NitT/TauT family transport system permease protein
MTAPGNLTGRPKSRRMSDGAISTVATAVLLVLTLTVLEIGGDSRWWSPAIMPSPSTVAGAAWDLMGQGQFWSDVGRTTFEIVMSMLIGLGLGLLVALGFWKAPYVGRILEPYLMAFYAVPLVLFYPVMMVLVGINAWSVIVLSSVMALIPMAVNCWVGLAEIPPVYLRLARSVRCTPWQTLTRIALPAAAPFIMAGLRLGTVYALIGAIAMEFTTAQAGMGYRIRYLYEYYATAQMYAYIVVVLVVSMILTGILVAAERALLARRGNI